MFRVSVLMPGPVQTHFLANMEASRMGGFDVIQKNPDIDDIDKEVASRLHDEATGRNYLGFPDQQPEDIAVCVRDILTAEEPHFLYQSSQVLKGKFPQTTMWIGWEVNNFFKPNSKRLSRFG